jgi:hypothetical protein
MTEFQNQDNNNFNTDYQPNNNFTMTDIQNGQQNQDFNQPKANQELATVNQSQPTTATINDFLKTKKGLYTRIKRAYLKRIGEDIEKGRKTNVDINKFIYDLIEQGIKGYEV